MGPLLPLAYILGRLWLRFESVQPTQGQGSLYDLFDAVTASLVLCSPLFTYIITW